MQVWPGLTAYPDFSDNVTHEWWFENLQRFHEKVPFDGLWIVSAASETLLKDESSLMIFYLSGSEHYISSPLTFVSFIC